MSLTHASAQPVGASVVAGQAQVLSSGATTVVNQNSAKAIINWQDFSVGAGASVQFNQPNSSAITLNRVTGSGVSNIDGAIRANGQVWLLNPNGVLFGNNARINVGGLLATTSDLANQDFLEGRYNFSGGGNGEIVNNGRIRAHGGGSVVLSGPRVTNRGLISARSGHVVLAGTDTFTVDFNGDRLLSYAVGASTQTGSVTNSVTNSGTVKAQGGQILMTARAASGVQDAVVNNSGMAEATSAHSVNGEIILDAGEGSAINSGTLDASGKAAGQTGGTVKVLGRLAAVPDNAVIDVSGNAGGGTAMIGGNFQGKGSEQHAQATNIGKASINADAIASGNGGKVAVWSDGRTDFAGSITARGGINGGNGGQVETSGHDLNIPASAFVSTLAVRGKSGSWLLDPHNINIVTGGSDPVAGQTFGNAPMLDANIDPAAIDVALRGGDVTLQAASSIIFQNNLTINSGGTAGRTLTLQAGLSITLGTSSLSYAAGNVVMIANDPGGAPTGFRDAGLATISTSGGIITASQLDLILNSDGVSNGTIGTSVNPLLIGSGTNVYLKTLNANAFLSSSGTLVIGNSNHTNGLEIGTGTATMRGSSIQQSAAIIASILNATATAAGAAGTLSLGGGNVIGTANLGANGAINLYNAGNLTIGSVTGSSGGNAASFVAQSTGTIAVASPSIGATINSTGVVMLHASGSIAQGTGTAIKGLSVSLISDNGTLGSAATPLSLMTNGLATRTLSRDQFFTIAPFNSSVLNFSSIVTTSTGLIAATSTPGVNAGSGGNVRIDASGMSVNSFSNGGSTFSINAGNFQVSAASLNISGATVNSLSASTSGNIVLNNNQSLQLNNLAGNPAISTPGTVNLSSIGNITQAAGAAGTITSTGAFTATATGSVILPNGLNAISGPVSLAGLGTIAFTNSVSTTLNRVAGNGNSQGAAPAQQIDIEVLGAGHSLTISAPNGTAVNGNGVTLHANGDILAGSNSAIITGINLGLISDTGSIGSFSSTGAGQLPLRGVGNLAARAAGNIYLISNAAIVNNAQVVTPITIGSVPNLGPGGGTLTGITAGGIVRLAFGGFDVFAPDLIKADTLFVSGNSVSLDNIAVNTLSAFSLAGDIDISSAGSFNINNTVSLTNGPGISTTGAVSLSSSGGSITQAAGASGAINAGTFSSFAVGGNNFNNTANAISSFIQIGSLADTTLVNSLNTYLVVALASGTLTVQSAGDLQIVAGPTISALSAASAGNGTNFKTPGDGTGTGNGNGGIKVNGTVVVSAATLSQLNGNLASLRTGGDGIVLSAAGKFINNAGATALVLPNGARFLIYSADPATDVFGGLKTPNQGIFGATYPTAITATGSRYIFSVASSTNTDFLGGGGLSQGSSTAAAPALAAFIVGLQPPPRTGNAVSASATATGSAPGGALAAPDAVRLNPLAPPPPPPPPPRNSPLADLSGPDGGNAETPSSSDQATSYVVSSLEGGPPLIVNGSSGGTLIPRYLTAQPALPSGTLTDPSELPGFGNLSLWQ